ncbi:MAG: hypothetical protein ACFFCI_08255 [Promethearchaeota archaeon]
MIEYETFMVYELNDTGERKRLNIGEDELQSNLNQEQVLVIVREDLRRIYIWKGPKSPVRKRFISSRVAQELQQELRLDSRYHRCKIVSVDAGDEPVEFLNAFQLESMEVTERLPDMRYVRNIERDGGMITKSTIIARDQKDVKEPKYHSPAIQGILDSQIPKPKTKTQVRKISADITKDQHEAIKDKILNTKVPEEYKRLNLILGRTLFAAISKTAKVFGKEVEETEWEPVTKVPKEMIELNNHVFRVYFDDKEGIVEAVEVLEKESKCASETKITTESVIETKTNQKSSFTPMPTKPTLISDPPINFNTMTVKELKDYAKEKEIDLSNNARKAEIIAILEESKKSNVSRRRKLPNIPKKED